VNSKVKSMEEARTQALLLLNEYGSCNTPEQRNNFYRSISIFEVVMLISLCQSFTEQPDMTQEQINFLDIIRELEHNLMILYRQRVEAN
jgi:hypothetical protein